jgi:hypothetical protein
VTRHRQFNATVTRLPATRPLSVNTRCCRVNGDLVGLGVASHDDHAVADDAVE